MLTYLSEISDCNNEEMLEKYNFILVQLENLISKYANIDADSNQCNTE